MIHSVNAFTIDCANPKQLAQFWADAFGTQITADYDYYVTISTPKGAPPAIGFQRVPEAKTTKNRVHLDIGADDREAEVARLIGMGARRLDDLPAEARRYVERISELLETPLSVVSVGSAREETILLQDPFGV